MSVWRTHLGRAKADVVRDHQQFDVWRFRPRIRPQKCTGFEMVGGERSATLFELALGFGQIFGSGGRTRTRPDDFAGGNPFEAGTGPFDFGFGFDVGPEPGLLLRLPENPDASAAAIRRRLGARKLRFATAEELRERTGLVSGDVPPFGEPILPFPLYADESLFENERIAFNAGSHDELIRLPYAEYERLVHPTPLLN